MRLTDARAIVPALHSRASEPDQDRAALLRLAHWATRWGPYVNLDDNDGLWIDVTGVAHLFGGEAALLHDIEHRLKVLGLTPHLGLADTYGGAWAIARYAPAPSTPTKPSSKKIAQRFNSRIAIKGQTKTALAHLPLSALRLDANIIQLLKRLGLYRIKDIYPLPRASLKTRFSSRENAQAVLMRLDQALGQMKEPKTPLSEPATYQAQKAYPDPLISNQGVESAISELAINLTSDLAKHCLGARKLRLTIYRVDASAIDIPIHQHTPSRNSDHIIRLFHEKISHYDAGFGIDLITLGAFDCVETGHTQSSFEAERAGQNKIAINQLLDRFENRLGPGTTYRVSPQESHIPERAQTRTSVANKTAKNKTVGEKTKTVTNQKSDNSAPWPNHTPPRPPLLLNHPEPITVMAEIPEGPPAQFTWRRSIHRITRAEGPERIAPEWWRELGQKETSVRDYYRVEDVHGQRYWLFRDGLYDGFYSDSDSNNDSDSYRGDDNSDTNTDTQTAPQTAPLWYMHGLFG